MLAERQKMKKQAEKEKAEIMEAFEKMKVKGKMDLKVMAKYGISMDAEPKQSTMQSATSARGPRPAPLSKKDEAIKIATVQKIPKRIQSSKPKV